MTSCDGDVLVTLIEKNKEALGRLCADFCVRRLELFGSAANGRFSVADSDLDFLVEFLPLEPGQRADAYFGLKEALEALLERRIDLVVSRAIKNRYFIEAVNRGRELLYAA